MTHYLNRREFMARMLAAAPVAALASRALAATPSAAKPPVLIFSKYLQFMDYKTLARTCRELGLDGIDLTVRPGGHVEPEKVDKDLPAAVEAIRGEGLLIPQITTKYVNVNGPNVKGVFARAAALGIPFVRVGSHQYEAKKPLAPQIAAFTEEMRGLAAEAEAAGVTLGYHNHSGASNFGAALWDLKQALDAVDNRRLGSNFDTGHACVEGGYYAWDLHARAMADRVVMVAVKDFVWEGNEPKWVPLGKGVSRTVPCLEILREMGGFSGPISIHIEYKVDSNDAMVEEVRNTVPVLRRMLKEAGYTA